MENKFYYFDSQGYLVTLAATPDIFEQAIDNNDFSENGGRHIINQLILGNYPESIHFPIDFTIFDGKKQRDVIEMQYGSAFLISHRIKQLFEDYNLTGWKPYDVIVRKKNGEIIPEYYGFTLTGRNVNPEIIPNADDVPDFFLNECWKGSRIICSQKVLDMLKENKIKDFNLIKMDENGEMITDLSGRVKL